MTEPTSSECVAEEPTTILSTGIEVLDRKLDGGVPAGRIVALSASPTSQSELFLYEMAAVRETVYLTTERTAADVEDSFEQAGTPLDGVEVQRIDPDDPISDARAALEGVSDGSTLIVDPVGPLEAAPEDQFRSFVNDLKARTVETESLTLLHCLDGRRVPPQRDRTEYIADIVFDLVTKLRGGSVENSLVIPKFRGGRTLPEAIELDLTTDVTIDVSRKIA